MKSTQSALLLAAVLPIGAHALVIQPLPEVVTLPHDVKHKGLTIPAGSRIRYDTDRNAPKTDWQQVLQTEKIHSIYFPKNMVWGGYRTNSLSFYSGKISLFTATCPKTRRALSNATANIAATPIIFTSIRPIGAAATPCLQAATRKTSPCVLTARHGNSATAP